MYFYGASKSLVGGRKEDLHDNVTGIGIYSSPQVMHFSLLSRRDTKKVRQIKAIFTELKLTFP